jgi:hypothetical protein
MKAGNIFHGYGFQLCVEGVIWVCYSIAEVADNGLSMRISPILSPAWLSDPFNQLKKSVVSFHLLSNIARFTTDSSSLFVVCDPWLDFA